MTQNATRGYASDIQPRMEQISAAKTQHLAVLLVVIQWWFCYILPQNRDLFSMILLHEVSSVKITFPQTTNFRAKKDEKSRIILCINNGFYYIPGVLCQCPQADPRLSAVKYINSVQTRASINILYLKLYLIHWTAETG